MLDWDAATGELVTRARGNAADRVGRPADAGQLGDVDPAARMIALHLYDGMLKIIPIDEKGALSEVRRRGRERGRGEN